MRGRSPVAGTGRRAGPRRLVRRRLAVLLMALAATGIASGAAGQELRLGVDTQYVYNSNFFSSAVDPDAANSFQIGPSVDLRAEVGRFQYEVGFDGAYQAYVDQESVNAWESRLRARATYDLSARTSIRVTERFRDISNLRFSRQDIQLGDTALDPNQDRYLRNDFELELLHDLTSLLQLRLRGAHHWVDFQENVDRNDSQAFDVAGELRFRVAPRHFLGAGTSYTNQDFEGAFSRLGSTGESVNSFLTWVWNVTDQITFTASGGPSWIRSDEEETEVVRQTVFVGGEQGGQLFRADFDSCDVATGLPASIPPSPIASNCDFNTGTPIRAADLGGLATFPLDVGSRVGTDSTLTFFGGASLSARLDVWNLEASYSRRQSTTSGDGLASSLDRIALELEYAPASSRWSAFLAGSWDRRETLTDATVVDFLVVEAADGSARRAADGAFSIVESSRARRDAFTLIGGWRFRFDEQVAGTIDGRYRRTEQSDRLGDRPGVDTFFFVVTLEYDFDPIAF